MCRATWAVARPLPLGIRWPCRPGIAQRRRAARGSGSRECCTWASRAERENRAARAAGRLCEPLEIAVLNGPQGAPDFFTAEDIATLFATDWEVHYNSSRTGVRLIGPKPTWARRDGGEAGLHPSNIHDNPYAVGAIDFTGDMPVILGRRSEPRRFRVPGNRGTGGSMEGWATAARRHDPLSCRLCRRGAASLAFARRIDTHPLPATRGSPKGGNASVGGHVRGDLAPERGQWFTARHLLSPVGRGQCPHRIRRAAS